VALSALSLDAAAAGRFARRAGVLRKGSRCAHPLGTGRPKLAPAQVLDRTDPKLVHLDGLNLSRARTLNLIAAALGAKDPRYATLRKLADAHAEASLPYVASGSYEGEHWLATFAVQMLDARAADP
jgi:hypothetical protein